MNHQVQGTLNKNISKFLTRVLEARGQCTDRLKVIFKKKERKKPSPNLQYSKTVLKHEGDIKVSSEIKAESCYH